MAKKNFYAVVKGHTPGIYTSWDEVVRETTGCAAQQKGFRTRAEAEAYFMTQPGGSAPPIHEEETADPMEELAVQLDQAALDQAQHPEMAAHDPILVFCGISVTGNGTDDARGAYSCVFPDFPTFDTAQPVRENHGQPVTNQRAYLHAAAMAITIANTIDEAHARPLRIITNNKVMNKSMDGWIEDWADNGGRRAGTNTPVENWDLIHRIRGLPREWHSIAWLHYDTYFTDPSEKSWALAHHKRAGKRAKRRVPPPRY